MITTVFYEDKHLNLLIEKDKTGEYKKLKDSGYLRHLPLSQNSYTVLDDKTKTPLGILGVVDYWPGRGEAWALIVTETKYEFLALHRAVKRFLSIYQGRLELVVEADHVNGHRWARILGFKLESLRKKNYFPNGKDAYMYVKITDFEREG